MVERRIKYWLTDEVAESFQRTSIRLFCGAMAETLGAPGTARHPHSSNLNAAMRVVSSSPYSLEPEGAIVGRVDRHRGVIPPALVVDV